MPVQTVLLVVPGRGKEHFPKVYWRGVGRCLGLRLTVIGQLAAERPVLFVANHYSWIDIIALGSVLPACFIAKAAVGGWPLIGWVAKLGRTVFVSRQRHMVGHERDALNARLAAGDNLILFPEGTTSDGNRVLPFAPPFLALADAPARPYVQPVTIVYDALDGLPVRHYDRPEIAWYGDMDLAPHYARIGRRKSLHATVILDAVIAPGTYDSRKTLARALHTKLAHQAATLRQGRFTYE
ncbi:MAG TPA: lysophospholipid acyltransferase family protein [Acidocella sp.]|nr:lysophospholipid acyltransferase family protein [Acidocella sp.]